jgi:hypothetical protein
MARGTSSFEIEIPILETDNVGVWTRRVEQIVATIMHP